MAEPPSSPPTDLSSPESALAYYKAQYEQLEQELSEFQASSQELEAELEKDVEAAEKRERVLKEKAESLGFEVDEWKASEPPSLISTVLGTGGYLEIGLTFAGKIQAIENRGRRGPKHSSKGNYYSSGFESDTSTKAARHRSFQ